MPAERGVKRCTFTPRGGVRCANAACHPLTDDGAIDLCDAHAARYEELQKGWLESGDASLMKQWIGFYVSAQGGAGTAAQRTMGTYQRTES